MKKRRRARVRLRFDIVTVFPEMFESPFGESMLRIAQQKRLVDLGVVNLRNYARDKRRTTDDKPFGGGPGMVMKPEPIFDCVRAIQKKSRAAHVIVFSPSGTIFDQKMARRLAKKKHLILICGHYEGIDHRVHEHLADEEISLGNFILTGGEIPAMAVVDAVTRLLPGVLGNQDSLAHETFETELVEYPQYTRPRAYRGWAVPRALLSGDHAKINEWRRLEALRRTQKHRGRM
ncbi:MAG: tRNA (guanosine(37)-N1)-methyltransferase TrmD [Candidatus Omnitrophica bacterium]|nr:tRNA (guanosine(37)-N1)-methyltransferase TrmD [Candidatus Omnitrophota bacterium]